MKPSIVIIGYGRFGKTFASILKKHCKVFVIERNKKIVLERGIKRITLEEINGKDIIILAVPINQMESVTKKIAPFISDNSLVCDVCSVKEQPIFWMNKYLPSSISIIGTHPMFGPESVGNVRNIFTCPVRVSEKRRKDFFQLLKKAQLSPMNITASQHDKLMAQSLFITQFIGRSIASAQLLTKKNVSMNCVMLNHIVSTSVNDSIELFRDMYRYNRFAKKIPEQIITAMKQLMKKIQTDKKHNVAKV